MGNKKTNKRGGINFLGEHVVGIIVAILCIIVLLFIGYKVYSIFSEKTELEKSETNLKAIKTEIELVKNSPGINFRELIIYPVKKWVLRSYSEGFPESKCYGKASCLCMCQEGNCAQNNQKVCYAFEHKVVILTSYSYAIFDYPNTIGFSKAAEGLKIYKQEDLIIIEKIEVGKQ